MLNKTACAAALAALVAAALTQVAAANTLSEWRFRVLLDDKEIGFHEFRVSQADNRQVVDSDARFDVKFLFFNAFSYRHQNQEVWSGNCLAQVNAATDSNGKETRVSGQRKDDGFLLMINDDKAQLPACVKTFAYWDPEIITAERLLNVQTGELEAVSASRLGTGSIMHNGAPIDAVHYQLATGRGDISLWYGAADGRWLALEAPAKGGRKIRYEPLSLPPSVGTQVLGNLTQRAGNEG